MYQQLKKNKGDYTLYDLKLDRFNIRQVNDVASQKIREALSEFRSMSEDDLEEWRKSSLAREIYEKEKKEMADAEFLKTSVQHMY